MAQTRPARNQDEIPGLLKEDRDSVFASLFQSAPHAALKAERTD